MLDSGMLHAAGVRILLHPVTLLLATISAQQAALASLAVGDLATTATMALAREVVRADEALAFQRHPHLT